LPPGREALIDLLASIYRAVDWRAQGGSSVQDRWSGMLMVASRAETVGELVNNLCKRLGVGSVWGDTMPAQIAACEPYEADLLDWVDRETVPVAMRAYSRARERRS